MHVPFDSVLSFFGAKQIWKIALNSSADLSERVHVYMNVIINGLRSFPENENLFEMMDHYHVAGYFRVRFFFFALEVNKQRKLTLPCSVLHDRFLSFFSLSLINMVISVHYAQ